MADTNGQILPHARRDGLVVETLPDEVLVYDVKRHKAHCLNRTAALVWEHCDGKTPVADVARRLTRELEAPVDDRVVWLAVEQLKKAHLLTEAPRPPTGLSRREMLKRLRIAAAVALPLVTTIVTPAAGAAASCIPDDQPCVQGSGPPCCSPNSFCTDVGGGNFQCQPD